MSSHVGAGQNWHDLDIPDAFKLLNNERVVVAREWFEKLMLPCMSCTRVHKSVYAYIYALHADFFLMRLCKGCFVTSSHIPLHK